MTSDRREGQINKSNEDRNTKTLMRWVGQIPNRDDPANIAKEDEIEETEGGKY